MDKQITITLSAKDAWWLRSACFDSYLYWKKMQDENPELNDEGCNLVKEHSLKFYDMLTEAGAAL